MSPQPEKPTLTSEQLTRRLAREKKARAQAEKLLEEKSTELYALNQELHQNVRLLEAGVINAYDGVVSTEAHMSYHGPKMIYMNDAFLDITGYTRQELIGKDTGVLYGEKTDIRQLKAMRRLLKSSQPYDGELICYKQDGTEFWMELSIAPVPNKDGEITHFTTIARDITDRRNYEEELKAARLKAEAANMAKSEFLATMSHELRTPMNGIIGMTELLLDTSITDQQKTYAQTVVSSAESLLNIINDILDFSKIESGKFEIEPVPMDLFKTIDHVVALLSPRARAKGLKFERSIHPDTPQYIIGDYVRIEQIIQNLIGNAIKFTERGGVALEVSLADEPRMSSAHIQISVTDSGVGIAKGVQDKIFDKFSQADTSTTRKYGGTGLGLTICQQLVEIMGGTITVDSTPGIGSTFCVTLPLKIDEKQGELAPKPLPTNVVHAATPAIGLGGGRKYHILVVEDNITNQMVVEGILERLGYKVTMASDGKEAIKCVEKDIYDLILMDVQMPIMDGFEATRILRQMEYNDMYHIPPIIALTANAMKGDKEKCFDMGMSDYIGKPIRKDEIEKILSRWTIAIRDNHKA